MERRVKFDVAVEKRSVFAVAGSRGVIHVAERSDVFAVGERNGVFVVGERNCHLIGGGTVFERSGGSVFDGDEDSKLFRLGFLFGRRRRRTGEFRWRSHFDGINSITDAAQRGSVVFYDWIVVSNDIAVFNDLLIVYANSEIMIVYSYIEIFTVYASIEIIIVYANDLIIGYASIENTIVCRIWLFADDDDG